MRTVRFTIKKLRCLFCWKADARRYHRRNNRFVFGNDRTPTKKAVLVTVSLIAMVCIVGLAVALGLFAAGRSHEPLFAPPSPSRLGKYRTAAVSSDGTPCSTIGR